ncbi:MAG TPA: LLM class F420-dependent oxidoreductase [Acidimicrobiia bacterium]|jgi:probable F420-dependent oxidoreductase
MHLKLGIVTPVLTMLPRAHATWEETAGFGDVVTIARAADALGYHHLTCSEHVAIPADVAAVRGGRYYDPLATFGYLAARTERIRLATHVLVLGYHHPLEIAKRYGTLDAVSGGRLILGVGVGSLEPEFALLGADFAERGARADEALVALRDGFAQSQPEHNGTYFEYSGLVVDPCGVQPRVPLWIGGRTARSLRRAVELADGWAPFGLSLDEIVTMLERARTTPAWESRATPIDVLLQPERAIDPTDDGEGTRAVLRALVAAGATGVNARFVHHSLSHYLEQLDAFTAAVAADSRA